MPTDSLFRDQPVTASLARPALRDVPVYSPTGSDASCAVDVSDTVNLWGPPPSAARALRDAPPASIARYGALYGADLKAPLAGYVGVRPEEIVTGCGSDDVIDCAMRAFGGPGGLVAHPAPTFSMIPVYARTNGMTPVAVPLSGDDYAVDADALVATGASVIYLCSPNNPTSTRTSRDVVLRVVERAPGLVIIDEAYAEFAGESYATEAPGWERVLVTRTMSKAWGMAGLRVGYGVAAPELVQEIEKARGPYKTTAPAERAVAAALAQDVPWMQGRVAEALGNRDRFIAGLRALGLRPAASAANFVFVPVPGAAELAGTLRAMGVAVRVFTGLPGEVPALREARGEALRFGVGPWATMQPVLDALQEALP
jgi:histidinol-phosphate aminotransferase